MAADSWWENRPFPSSIVWDIAEGVALVLTFYVFWKIAEAGRPDGYDYRDQKWKG